MSLQTTIQARGDGTGGLLLSLPKEVVDQLRWVADDKLIVNILSESEEMVLRRVGEINQKQFDEMRARGRR